MRQRVELCCFLLLAYATSVGAADWPQVPEPEGAQSEWVSRDMRYNGIPMRISRFDTVLSVQQVVDFYNKQWPGQVVTNAVGGKTIVGHSDGVNYVTIEITGNGAGSRGQIGVVKMLKQQVAYTPGADFLKPSGTQVINDITYLDVPGRTLSMESPLSPSQSESFYRSRLPGSGWSRDASVTPCSMIANSCTARYSKGDQEMTMTFSRHEQGTSIVVNQTQH